MPSTGDPNDRRWSNSIAKLNFRDAMPYDKGTEPWAFPAGTLFPCSGVTLC